MADPTIFEWQVQDDQGTKNRIHTYMAYNGATETVDSLIGGWTAFGDLIDAGIDGQILKGRITIPLIANAGWKAAPNAGNNCNQVMVVNFDNDFNSYATPLLLPSYQEALLDAQGRPDIADAALAAIIAAVIDDTGTQFFNSRSLHDLNAFREAFLTTRKVKDNRRITRQIA